MRATNTHFFIELLEHEAVYSKNIHAFLKRKHFCKQRQAKIGKKNKQKLSDNQRLNFWQKYPNKQAWLFNEIIWLITMKM